jgi:hypothetical protein
MRSHHWFCNKGEAKIVANLLALARREMASQNEEGLG